MYPIYDRSGVDDDIPRPLAQSTAPSPRASSAPLACEVLVCHAGTCRRAGAEAVLTEIEELHGKANAWLQCVAARPRLSHLSAHPPRRPPAW